MHVDLFWGHSHFQLVINSQWACSLELKSHTMSYRPNVCMLKYSMTIPIKIPIQAYVNHLEYCKAEGEGLLRYQSGYLLYYKLEVRENHKGTCQCTIIPLIQLGDSRKRGRQHSTEADFYPLVCTLQHSIGFLFG